MSAEFITVTVLNTYLKNIIDSEDMLHNISLAGEVSGIKCSGAHSYFTLKDENAQIPCCCFNYSKTYKPKDGETVVLKGNIDFYSKGGKITFIANKIEPLGMGLLALKLEELKKRLTEQGYFDVSHKVAIPKYCDKVCVITSKTGAVIRDIISTARKNNKLINIDVFDVKVQGAAASEEIITALKIADKLSYDAIIIARGGGSFEDLMPFNDEKLVYAIFEAMTPIISAVGHETDFTLCDFVADIRVPTPTASAELVAFNVKDVVATFGEYNRRMKKQLFGYVTNQYYALSATCQRLVGSARVVIEHNIERLRAINIKNTNIINTKLIQSEHEVIKLMSKIEGNNPIKILKQGYAKTYDDNGHQVEVAKLNIGDKFTVLGDSARVVGEVIAKENKVL